MIDRCYRLITKCYKYPVTYTMTTKTLLRDSGQALRSGTIPLDKYKDPRRRYNYTYREGNYI